MDIPGNESTGILHPQFWVHRGVYDKYTDSLLQLAAQSHCSTRARSLKRAGIWDTVRQSYIVYWCAR